MTANSSKNDSVVEQVRPGAYAIPGIDSQPATENPSDNVPETEGPTEIIQIGRECIIEGTVVQTEGLTTKRCKIEKHFFALSIFSFVITLIVIFVAKRRGIEAQIRTILIPISGKDQLEDKESVQHYAFKTVVARTHQFDEYQQELQYPRKVALRYLSVLIPLSTMSAYQYYAPSGPPLYVCHVYTCNDEGEIAVVIFRNSRNTVFGGGFIAKEIGELTGLTDLVLARNDLKGTIPTELGTLKDLRTIDLRGNQLTGTIPTEIGQLENLELLFLDGNFLEGTIPSELGKLKNLIIANLSENLFSGEISSDMIQMNSLEAFSLNDNNLNGTIDFMCEKNFTNEWFEKEMHLEHNFKNYSYMYTGNLGLTVDCVDDVPILDCRCCTCK